MVAITTKIGKLWDRALDYADMTNSTFPDINRKLDLLNSAFGELHALLVNAGLTYFVKTGTITVTPGTAQYDLAANSMEDMYKLLKVFLIQDGRMWVMRSFEFERADSMLIAPQTGCTVQLFYVPRVQFTSADLTTGDSIDALNYPLGWEDYVALTIAIRLLVREESDTSALDRERARLEKMIRDMAPERDLGEPPVIEDVYKRYESAWYRIVITPPSHRVRYRLEGTKIRFLEFDWPY